MVTRQHAARSLGVGAGAAQATIAKAAIERERIALGLSRRASVRLAQDMTPLNESPRDGALRELRFVQTLGGLRVVWSKIDVALSGRVARNIGGTVMPIRGALAGVRRLSEVQARAAAVRVLPAAAPLDGGQLVVYAGTPVRPRAPRRAWLFQAQASEAKEGDPVCVVIDAETGQVLVKWRGTAGRKLDPGIDQTRARAKAAALPQRALVNISRGGGIFYVPYSQYFTTGDLYSFGNDVPLGYNFLAGSSAADPLLDNLGFRVVEVGHFVCPVRGFCGRDGGRDSSVEGIDVTGNYTTGVSQYQPAGQRVYLERRASEDSFTIAHELGHMTDVHLANDVFVLSNTQQGAEVSEAFADMFAYDFLRERADVSVVDPTTSLTGFLADPTRFVQDGRNRPVRMRDYACSTPGNPVEVRFNGTMLSHAYWLFVSRVGHPIAGRILHYVSGSMPGARRFIDVQRWFAQRAADLYPTRPEIRDAAIASFYTSAGIGREVPAGGPC